MSKTNLFTRIAAVAAAATIPVVAGAAVGEDFEPTTAAPTGTGATVWLEANLTGVVRLRVYQRSGANLQTADFNYVTSSTPLASATANFDAISANPPTAGTDEGLHLDAANGAIFVAQLRADLYFTGANSADVDIQEATTAHVNPGVEGTDYDFRFDCANGINSNTVWYSGADINLTNGTQNDALANCFSGTIANAGVTFGSDVDLALIIADSAPSGSYREGFEFLASINP